MIKTYEWCRNQQTEKTSINLPKAEVTLLKLTVKQLRETRKKLLSQIESMKFVTAELTFSCKTCAFSEFDDWNFVERSAQLMKILLCRNAERKWNWTRPRIPSKQNQEWHLLTKGLQECGALQLPFLFAARGSRLEYRTRFLATPPAGILEQKRDCSQSRERRKRTQNCQYII